MAKKGKKKRNTNTISENRKARHTFELLEKFEAGIELKGTEVKSLREGKVSLAESYARIRGGELFLLQANISPYESGSYFNHDPTRARKLLMHRREIDRLASILAQKNLTLVPTRMYWKRGNAKVQIALARAKQKHEKRDAIREREDKRRIEREMARRR